jgi:hypothetical protein
MGLIDCLEDYDIEMFEYGHLVEQTSHSSFWFKLYIPKLMATFPLGDPAQTRWVFNNNIFLNDDACKPITGKNITTQNFVNAHRHYNLDFGIPADHGGWLYKGQRFMLQFMDRNIRDMRIMNIM